MHLPCPVYLTELPWTVILDSVLFRPHHWQAWALHYWGRRIWEQKKHVQYFPTRQFLRSLLPQHPSIQLKVDDQEYWPKMRIHIWIWIVPFPMWNGESKTILSLILGFKDSILQISGGMIVRCVSGGRMSRKDYNQKRVASLHPSHTAPHSQ